MSDAGTDTAEVLGLGLAVATIDAATHGTLEKIDRALVVFHALGDDKAIEAVQLLQAVCLLANLTPELVGAMAARQLLRTACAITEVLSSLRIAT